MSPRGRSFQGWLTVTSEPGVVLSVTGPESSTNHARLDLADGATATMTVSLALGYGPTRIWVVDEGFLPATGAPAACMNASDDDGDGLADDVQDPGCASAEDGSEEGGSMAAGISPQITFVNPRISDVQGDSWESPLMGRAVRIDRGRLVVTRISSDGFWVTDIDPAAPAGGSNSLYAFNYNTPWHLRECDLLTDLTGIVGEFYGYTELQFPSWTVADPDGRVPEPTSSAECPIPAPFALEPGTAGSDAAMERLESGLVRVSGGRIGTMFVDCDLDGNGVVDFTGSDGECRLNCENHAECTELNQYMQYGQYSLVLDGCTGSDCTRIWAVTRDAVPGYWADHHAGAIIAVLTGTVRHVEFLDPSWIIEPRCEDDLVLSGAPLPMWEACVPPYARGEYEDDN